MNSHQDYINALEKQDYENRNNDLQDLTFPKFDFTIFTSSIIFIANFIRLINIFTVICISSIIIEITGIDQFLWKCITLQYSNRELQPLYILIICSISTAVIFIVAMKLSDNINAMKNTYNGIIKDKDNQIMGLADKIFKLNQVVDNMTMIVDEIETNDEDTISSIHNQYKKLIDQKNAEIYKLETYITKIDINEWEEKND
jgi:hypothetical protein